MSGKSRKQQSCLIKAEENDKKKKKHTEKKCILMAKSEVTLAKLKCSFQKSYYHLHLLKKKKEVDDKVKQENGIRCHQNLSGCAENQ